MTVCTASVFQWFYGEGDQGTAIITASDRMLTDVGLGIEYESSHFKLAHFGTHRVVLVAGDLSTNSLVLQALHEREVNSPSSSTIHLAIALGDVMAVINADRAMRKYTAPLGLTNQAIREHPDGLAGFGIPDHLLEALAGQIQSEELDCEAIVVGNDNRIPTLMRVDGRGIFTNHLDIGFLSIGSGGIHSSAFYMQLPFHHHVGYHAALQRTFFAKKRAEVSPGVGAATDMFLSTADGVSPIGGADIRALESTYRRYNVQTRKLLDRFALNLAKQGQK